MSYQENPGPATLHELPEGELLEGDVVRLPMRGAHNGTRIFIKTGQGVVAVPAAGRRGHTMLERELERQSVQKGDLVRIVWHWAKPPRATPSAATS